MGKNPTRRNPQQTAYTYVVCGRTGPGSDMIEDRDLGTTCSDDCYETAELEAIFDARDIRARRELGHGRV